jgi:hypothetical protein
MRGQIKPKVNLSIVVIIIIIIIYYWMTASFLESKEVQKIFITDILSPRCCSSLLAQAD